MEVWVSGLADTSQSPALGYMEVVHQRDAATLIHAHVAPGTEVYTFRPPSLPPSAASKDQSPSSLNTLGYVAVTLSQTHKSR